MVERSKTCSEQRGFPNLSRTIGWPFWRIQKTVLNSRSLLTAQLQNLVEQCHCLRRTCDPRCCACTSCLEVVRPCAKKLVSYVQRSAPFNAAEVSLAGSDTPGLVAYIDKDLQWDMLAEVLNVS